jgi:hypothetical protein
LRVVIDEYVKSRSTNFLETERLKEEKRKKEEIGPLVVYLSFSLTLIFPSIARILSWPPFHVSDIHPRPEEEESAFPDGEEIPYGTLPSKITLKIRESLAFLPRRRLVFLNTDGWVCTWVAPLPESDAAPPVRSRTEPVSVLRQSNGEVNQHYFLPGDWFTPRETHLCRVMPDGTLLCPRNRDVVAVQCAKLSKI